MSILGKDAERDFINWQEWDIERGRVDIVAKTESLRNTQRMLCNLVSFETVRKACKIKNKILKNTYKKHSKTAESLCLERLILTYELNLVLSKAGTSKAIDSGPRFNVSSKKESFSLLQGNIRSLVS